MDKILTGILLSDKPVTVKKIFIEKIEKAASLPQTDDIIKGTLDACVEHIVTSGSLSDSTHRVYLNWAKNNMKTFEEYFSNGTLIKLLDEKNKNGVGAIHVLSESLKLLAESERPTGRLETIVEAKSIGYIRENRCLETLHRFCELLKEYPQCIPKGDFAGRFCIAVIRNLSELSAVTDGDPGQFFVSVDDISKFLGFVWNRTGFEALLQSLQVIFKIISTDEDDPSVALASVVQNIPVSMIGDSIKAVLNQGDKKDLNLKVALLRMMDWLRWLTATNVHLWLLAYMKGLASIKRFRILMDVTLVKVEQVFSLLRFPGVRVGAMAVLNHILLSFQHCPKAFHKIVVDIPEVVKLLDNSDEAGKECLLQLVELTHTLIHLHPGFPELYDPVVEGIKDHPKPALTKIKENLTLSHWTARTRDNSISVTVEQKSETGKTGLVNLGNTCYANSVLQAIYMCDSFRKSILAQPICRFQPLLIKLQRVFAFLTLTQRAAYSPTNFVSASRPSWFIDGHQQDCSEYLKYMLDQLHEQETLKLKQQAEKDAAETAAKDVNDGRELQSLIHSHFAGKVQTTYKCKSCCSNSSRTESFIDIPLAIPDKDSSSVAGGGDDKEPIVLDDLIKYYLEPETLKGDNQYHCENCEKLQDAERSIRIVESPQVLVLNLLRFSYDVKMQSRSKILTDVTYPKTLLLPVAGDENALKTKRKHSQNNELIDHKVYGLYAVIVHSGTSSESGHYYCYARHCVHSNQGTESSYSVQNGAVETVDYLQDKWYLFNDSRVSYSNFESFSGVTKRFSRDTAYVLCYKRLDLEDDETSTQHDLDDSLQAAVLDGPLRKDLHDIVQKDNLAMICEQERTRKRRESMSESNTPASYFHWDDESDDGTGPPGNCGGTGFGGLDSSGPRFVC
ncbi:ubiquitin carboxyl-terminal hydrolase 38-like [Tubulanus polymorphus]|uniref:ubiquitin carboxyl-terminal hydrolase 38-like n=1 Tax=Tubulanus polymorphus TaxID=672921 RepID=UPI003DA5FA9E